MRLHKFLFLLFIFFASFSMISCQKEDNSSEIKTLKESIAALQKRSDSLSTALGVTNSNLGVLAKTIDSIKIQLSSISSQLTLLNAQLNSLNTNILTVNAQISLLNQQYSELLAKLNLLLSQLPNTPSSLSTGLVAYYPFTGNAGDSSGFGNHGSVVGAVLTNDRFNKVNAAYSFSSSTISIPHNATLGFTQNAGFSVSIWVYRTGAQKVMHFIGKRPQGSQAFNWQLYFIETLSNNGLTFFSKNGTTVYGAISSNFCETGIWSNLIGVYDFGTWKLFQNGIEIAKASSPLFYNDVVCPLTIGNSGGFEPFYGKLDDIRIYNRALTQDEITYLASH